MNISDSNFTNNGDSNQRLGGAIYISQSDIAIYNSSFTNNTANEGGAVYFGCTLLANCNLTLTIYSRFLATILYCKVELCIMTM